MNIASLIALLVGLIPHVVLGVETLIGDSQSGASKKQMATDALNIAVGGADAVLTGTNLQLANAAGAVASTIIDKSVKDLRATGQYQAATKTGNALQAAAVPTPPAA